MFNVTDGELLSLENKLNSVKAKIDDHQKEKEHLEEEIRMMNLKLELNQTVLKNAPIPGIFTDGNGKEHPTVKIWDHEQSTISVILSGNLARIDSNRFRPLS